MGDKKQLNCRMSSLADFLSLVFVAAFETGQIFEPNSKDRDPWLTPLLKRLLEPHCSSYFFLQDKCRCRIGSSRI